MQFFCKVCYTAVLAPVTYLKMIGLLGNFFLNKAFTLSRCIKKLIKNTQKKISKISTKMQGQMQIFFRYHSKSRFLILIPSPFSPMCNDGKWVHQVVFSRAAEKRRPCVSSYTTAGTNNRRGGRRSSSGSRVPSVLPRRRKASCCSSTFERKASTRSHESSLSSKLSWPVRVQKALYNFATCCVKCLGPV